LSKLIDTNKQFIGDYTIVTSIYTDDGLPKEVSITQEIHSKEYSMEDMDGLEGGESSDKLFYKSNVILSIDQLYRVVNKVEGKN